MPTSPKKSFWIWNIPDSVFQFSFPDSGTGKTVTIVRLWNVAYRSNIRYFKIKFVRTIYFLDKNVMISSNFFLSDEKYGILHNKRMEWKTSIHILHWFFSPWQYLEIYRGNGRNAKLAGSSKEVISNRIHCECRLYCYVSKNLKIIITADKRIVHT